MRIVWCNSIESTEARSASHSVFHPKRFERPLAQAPFGRKRARISKPRAWLSACADTMGSHDCAQSEILCDRVAR
ncbi:MAG: hypothetical protein EAZ43_12590 [Betaproteobacteria bacterium]|nr:MAG: hypothetical protein EAZ43_12590 [Betaproteobacteria bacterium]